MISKRKQILTTLPFFGRIGELASLFLVNCIGVITLEVADYGSYKALFSLVSVVSLVSTFAIPAIFKNLFSDISNFKAEEIRFTAYSITFFISLFAVLLLFILVPLIDIKFGFYVFPIAAFIQILTIFRTTFEAISYGMGNPRRLIPVYYGSTAAIVITSYVFYATGQNSVEVFLLINLSSFLALFIVLIFSCQTSFISCSGDICKLVIKSILGYGKYLYASNLFSLAAFQASAFIIMLQYGKETAGIIGFSLSLLMPFDFLCIYLADISYRRIKRENKIPIRTKWFAFGVVSLSTLPLLALTTLTDSFVPEVYKLSCLIVSCACISLPLRVLFQLNQRLIVAREDGKYLLAVSFFSGVAFLVFLLWGGSGNGFYAFIGAYFIRNFLNYVLTLFYTFDRTND